MNKKLMILAGLLFTSASMHAIISPEMLKQIRDIRLEELKKEKQETLSRIQAAKNALDAEKAKLSKIEQQEKEYKDSLICDCVGNVHYGPVVD